MTIQQSTQDRNRHLSELNDGNIQQVNCKGDKIENIGQLLMHLGMDNIKNKCDDCDVKIRHACLEKQSQSDNLNSAKQLNDNTLNEHLLTAHQCPERNLFQTKWPSDIKLKVESKLILSSLFASVLVVVMTLH
ncbi:hypothetical protein [Moritella sp.]|uniref:hypothetical protein n=1 Tax=Moritella sp. TaxID=78556 RepID=UPI001D6C5861|nr:hypothetical protein [Moritella sp.]MCJ8350419.1 hypothetical protein [Moritella sp.]NQZ40114.1 hypothetical protein [Moritella sp.]